MPRLSRLHLSAALDANADASAPHASAHAEGNSEVPEAQSHTDPGRPAQLTAQYWTELVRLAEEGALDFVTLHDSFAPPPAGESGAGRLDAVSVLARVAPETSRIGLVPTVTTTHTEPFHTSTALATLDFVSEGRAGWLVEVSTGEAEARAFGRREPGSAAGLWSEAVDAAEVAARLWDSWQDDAEIRDAATGRFIDRDRLHYIDFTDQHFSVRGPSIVPRPPQGRPPVAVAIDPHDSDGRWVLAAHHADIVLLDADTPATARLAGGLLRRQTADAGRDPDALRVLLRVVVDLTNSSGTRIGSRPPADTVRFKGSPAELADLLADWHAAGAADGFHLVPASARADLSAVVHELVPRLRELGLLGPGYEGRTLRDHLGLSRPANRYAPEVTR